MTNVHANEFDRLCNDMELPPGLPIKPGTIWEQLSLRCQSRAAHRYAAQCARSDARLEFGFVRQLKFNAWATTRDGVDFIGINIGVYFVLRDLFDRMLSHPEVLVEIGNPSSETMPLAACQDLTVVDLPDQPPERPFKPNDPARAVFSTKLVALGFDLIFQHEFGHIFNGHIDWLKRNSGFLALNEVEANDVPGLSGLDRQTLEMDADTFAVVDGLNRVWHARTNPDPLKENSSDTPKLLLRLGQDETSAALFAYYCVWRLFSGETNREVDQILEGRHPPVIYRQRYLLQLAMELAVREKAFTRDEMKIGTINCIREAEAAFTKLTGSPINQNIHSDDTFAKSGELLKRLSERWQTLRPELLPLKRGGVLAA